MEKLLVIKLGGNIIDDEKKLQGFLHSFARIDSKKILVHGGGVMATRLAAQLNFPQQMVEGRRVTDAETLRVITMVYGGHINKTIVAQLQDLRCNAIGLTGADGNLIRSHKRKHAEIDFGFVGDVDEVNAEMIKKLLSMELTPVIAPLTHDKKGQLLNTNADTIAQEIAKRMSGDFDTELLYLFDKNGVLENAENENSTIRKIDPENFSQLKNAGSIHSGMIPKLDNAFNALNSGVKKVIIGNAAMLTELIAGNAGTLVTNQPSETRSPDSGGYKERVAKADSPVAPWKSAVSLLKELISAPSFSREEAQTAGIIMRFLEDNGCKPQRAGNNIYSIAPSYDAGKPTLLLNSHHDTVKPNSGYTIDPFNPVEKEGKLYGLGSNDAGGALVSLIMAFLHFYNAENLKYNLIFAASAEEEISGAGGIQTCLKQLPVINCAIVGEPTLMQMAVAERGLMVLDCKAKGRAGHAARNEGENALHIAINDIATLRSLSFARISELLGPVQLNVTVMDTLNKAHNIVPAECNFVVDARVNELYTLEDVLEIIKGGIQSEVTPRSMRLRSTSIALDHPLVEAGLALGRNCYGSPTTSDKALMPFPALKMGPGDSARSHIADEFIYVDEIKEGIEIYISLLKRVLQ